MAKNSNVATSMDHSENFIDLDDLDLAGIDLTSGGAVLDWPTTVPTTSALCGCSSPSGPY